MKMNKLILSLAAIVILLTGCKEDWEEHYNTPPETVDKNMWEVIQTVPELSKYVEYMQEFEFDTLFEKGATYTLCIPNNDAFDAFITTEEVTDTVLNYHISAHFVQSGNIVGTNKVQMIAEKYVLFEHYNNTSLFDGIPLEFESPLYLNGKYFIMGEVAKPKPNLFEYYAFSNPILKSYILDKDSIILDKEKSRPIGFNDNGETEYDTVSVIYNEFEEFYFPVREEFRNKTATMVFPKAEDYNAALDIMAATLGDLYQDYKDIPLDWQNDILIPYLLEHGVFENSLTETDFIQSGRDSLKLKNILGDSIVIEYQVADKFICSNGVSFNYQDFAIPDTLFKGSVRIETEWYVKETGISKYTWREEITDVSSSTPFIVVADSVPTASNDSLIHIDFGQGYSGNYSVSFKIDKLFPREYLMVVKTKGSWGAVFEVYINDVLIRTIDYDTYHTGGSNLYYHTGVTGIKYKNDQPKKPTGGVFWDALASYNDPYGETVITFKYVRDCVSPSVINNGLYIDYIDFIPLNN
jgi:hypothetical protein